MSGPVDLFTAPLRWLVGAGERGVGEYSPVREVGELERRLEEAVSAIQRAGDSMEHHVAVVETLANSVPALTDSVNSLVKELNGLLAVLAPVAGAEREIAGAEREISRVEQFFGRRKRSEQITSAGGPGQPPPGGSDIAGA